MTPFTSLTSQCPIALLLFLHWVLDLTTCPRIAAGGSETLLWVSNCSSLPFPWLAFENIAYFLYLSPPVEIKFRNVRYSSLLWKSLKQFFCLVEFLLRCSKRCKLGKISLKILLISFREAICFNEWHRGFVVVVDDDVFCLFKKNHSSSYASAQLASYTLI